MKKILFLAIIAMAAVFTSCKQYDDSALRNDINGLKDRVTALETTVNAMNSDIASLKTIVQALQNGDYITNVQELTDHSGYSITFAKSGTIVIKNGTNGIDAPNIPIIGVDIFEGVYYWTITTNGVKTWLTDNGGNKLRVTGENGTNGTNGTDGQNGTNGQDGKDGTNGANGQDGKTPILGVDAQGYWTIDVGDGAGALRLKDANGQDVKAVGTDGANGTNGTNGQDGANGTNGTNGTNGDSFFKSVTQDDSNVYFTLADNTVISIPKGNNSQFAIAFNTTDIAITNGGGTKTISYTITGATASTIIKTVSQDGWKAKVNPTSTSTGTIIITAPDPIVESEILVFANDGSYRTVMATLDCARGTISIANNSVEVTPAGGIQEVKLATNLNYSVDIPANAQSWISVANIAPTRAMRNETISFNIAANPGIQRFATVSLKDESGNTVKTIIFRQLGTCTEVNVAVKGGLEAALAGYDYANINSLKITGVLNDVDFLFIYRMMPSLKNLDISEVNITVLPTQAFYNSINVENLILPNTLTTIGQEVFYNSKLKSVFIPQSVETIEQSAFRNSSNLAIVTFENGSNLKIITGGTASPSYGAFYGCTSLIAIEIPASVETIGATAFYNCSKLATVTFEKGSNLKTIGGGEASSGAFYNCSTLTAIEIPASVETIEQTAFGGCSSLVTVTFEKGSNLKTFEKSVFASCSSLTAIEIPASVETIEGNAFYNCSKLTTVTFEKGSNLKTIGGGYGTGNISASYYYGAFSGCPLATIEIPASVETIEAVAFKGCSKLTTVTFEKGSNLKTIGGGYYITTPDHSSSYAIYYGAFSDCSSLTTITIPASVETIEASAFKGCSNLANVTFESGSNLKTIGGGYSSYATFYYGAFSDCSSLTAIKIPASVETIGQSAFRDCSKLATVTFEKGSNLKTIGGGYSSSYSYGIFYGCSSLTAIEIPSSVETIEAAAFRGCSNLATVTFESGSNLKTIGGGYYSGYSSSYYYGTFSELKKLMTFDASACTQLTSIGQYAFYSDSELRLFKIGTITPPACQSNAFNGINPSSVLKVPPGCAGAYMAATEWSRFASITGLDE